ncbi:MAG TPA: glutathione S-transferase family protein [Rhizomicrobium sp.]|jgi:glutathione S-transferase|nr:glutathione S-transferase family protein [Rhizomicrobium sp.]
MITLYHRPQTRSGSIVWLLEEMGVPYETRIVKSLRGPDGSGARDPDNPHPHGKVPALVDDGHTIFESGAIALYLTDKFPKAKMGPLPGDARRGEYLSWLFYRPGVMEPAFMERRFNIQHVFGPMGWAPPEEVEQVVNDHLAKNSYFLGDEFSALDVMVGGGMFFMVQFKMMAETPVVKDYCSRITARPAFAKMMAS